MYLVEILDQYTYTLLLVHSNLGNKDTRHGIDNDTSKRVII